MVRIGSSVGAGNVTTPIVTWTRNSGVTHNLVTVRDSSTTFAELTINGPGNTDGQTTFNGTRLRVNASNIIINPTTGTGAGTGTFLWHNTSLWGSDPNPSWGGGIGVLYFGSTISPPTSGGPFMFKYGYGIATRFNGGDIFAYDGASTTRPDILARLTREEGHYGGVCIDRVRTRGLYAASAVVWSERATSFGPGPNGQLLRYWIPDETTTTLEWRVTMCRTTNATKGGTFRGKATIRRTGGAMPVHVGISPQYETDVETTAGDGVDIFIHPVAYDPDPFSGFGLVYEVQIRPVTADSDGRRWFMRCEVEEVRGT
jgi:hypothetical protein